MLWDELYGVVLAEDVIETKLLEKFHLVFIGGVAGTMKWIFDNISQGPGASKNDIDLMYQFGKELSDFLKGTPLESQSPFPDNLE